MTRNKKQIFLICFTIEIEPMKLDGDLPFPFFRFGDRIFRSYVHFGRLFHSLFWCYSVYARCVGRACVRM